jgi:hypothetical protein
MKRNINSLKFLPVLLGILFVFFSCEYEEIVPVQYPEGLIYLPAASAGVYKIEAVSESDLATPTEGYPSRYEVNKTENRFEIPLSVYRSGLDLAKTVSINIQVKNDTISELIHSGTLDDATLILPADKFEIAGSLQLASGERTGAFSLSVDLDFLEENAPALFAAAIKVSSQDVEDNPDLSTVIILIDTQIFIPVAGFKPAIDAQNYKRVSFVNNSKQGVEYNWDFGDGNSSKEKAPVHVYAEDGAYTVKLEVTGISGKTAVETIDMEIKKAE